MMFKHDGLISELLETSKKSSMDKKLAAVIVYDKGAYALDKPQYNIPKTYNNCTLIEQSKHAEVNAMEHYFNKPQNKKNYKTDLLVGRFDSNGKICNARPCNSCLRKMKNKIRMVGYTTLEGTIEWENVTNMLSIQVTNSYKYNHKLNGLELYKYYNTLLKQQFKQPIYAYNLHMFIKYNLNIILPSYKYFIYKKNHKQLYIKIVNSNNMLIIDTIIII